MKALKMVRIKSKTVSIPSAKSLLKILMKVFITSIIAFGGMLLGQYADYHTSLNRERCIFMDDHPSNDEILLSRLKEIDVTGKSEGAVEKIIRGILRNLNTDEYYVDDSETYDQK